MTGAEFLATLAIIGPAFLIAITVHEFAHAFVATYLGDDTPRLAGRLTLNPFKHLDLMGTIFLFLFRIGWAKPVPFNPYNFKYPRLYSVFVALAGPSSNILVALCFLYGIKYLPLLFVSEVLIKSIKQILEMSVYINIMLGIFNLIPIPPLDGSHLLRVILPARFRYLYYIVAQYSIIILLLLFYLEPTRSAFVQSITATKSFLEMLVI